ncbi:MAG: hypothetical protein RBS01_02975 [Candidatus Dojkabacteria bacterium]|jgi:hypothetical protein|nr:hypothetical protein [Candidatus Dojkabacteria bacterium]
MNEPYISSIYRKDSKKASILNSNILRLSLFALTLVIYTLFISPLIEGTLRNSILNGIRESKKVTLNYLTPLYGQEMYTNEYTLNTISTTDVFTKVSGKTDIKTEDPRVVVMKRFLLDYNSPMYPSARTFIEEADRYGLDWRLVASISGVESAFGNLIPRGTNNAWGWRGVNKNEQGWSQFSTWDEGISIVTSRLALGYGTSLTPFQIEATYCPPCGLNPAHAWANGVARYMRELKYYLDNIN